MPGPEILCGEIVSRCLSQVLIDVRGGHGMDFAVGSLILEKLLAR
jgi:hypothetical protein